MSQQYGYANVFVQNQNANNIQGAMACVIEQSACLVYANFFDTTGTAIVPTALRYRVDDVLSGTNIVPWAGIPATATASVIVTSLQNQMISQSLESECHQVLFQFTDAATQVYYSSVLYIVKAAAGL